MALGRDLGAYARGPPPRPSPPRRPACQHARVSALDNRPGCPTCLGDPFTGFDWEDAERGRLHAYGSPPVNILALRRVASAKGGDVLRCSHCGRSYLGAIAALVALHSTS